MVKKVLKVLLAIVAVLIILFVGYLMAGHYNATSTAVGYSDYTQENDYLEFDNDSTTGFIFYPGAKVEALSYSYLSDVDANVYIAEFPFEMAMFDYKIAQDIIDDNPQVNSWYIGGHSLGGVFAAEFVADNPDLFDGVIYLASYPADGNDLQEDELAIFGAEDLVVGDYTQHLEVLGQNAQVEVLENANHSGFGDYGQQKGDSELSAEQNAAQRDEVVTLINEFINQ